MDYVAFRINKLADLDIFKNTRKRKYVEARSLFCFICYKFYNKNYSQIALYLKNKGKSSDHATVLHALKGYEIYSKYNTKLNIWLDEILNCDENLDRNQKLELMFHKIKQLKDNNLNILSNSLDEVYTSEIEQEQIQEYINETTES